MEVHLGSAKFRDFKVNLCRHKNIFWKYTVGYGQFLHMHSHRQAPSVSPPPSAGYHPSSDPPTYQSYRRAGGGS